MQFYQTGLWYLCQFNLYTGISDPGDIQYFLLLQSKQQVGEDKIFLRTLQRGLGMYRKNL